MEALSHLFAAGTTADSALKQGGESADRCGDE
jgi:hypothetical protein